MIQLKISHLGHSAKLTFPAKYERVVLALWSIGLDHDPEKYTLRRLGAEFTSTTEEESQMIRLIDPGNTLMQALCLLSEMMYPPHPVAEKIHKKMAEGGYASEEDFFIEMESFIYDILVKGMNSPDGVLVNSEGFGYARYTAYLPAAQAFLNEQKLLQEQETTPESVRREISQEELAMMYGQHILWAEGGDGVGEQAVFSNCLLSGLDMRGMQFNNAIFWDATFEQMDMQGAGVCFSEFQGAHFINCSMDNLCADEANFRECTFDGCSLHRAKLLHCNLTQAQFQNTSLSGADLRWSCVDGIRAEEPVLEQANTKNVSFSECAWIEEATPAKEPAMEMSSM